MKGKQCLAKCFYLIAYLQYHNYTTVQWYETNGLKKIVQKSKKNNDEHLKVQPSDVKVRPKSERVWAKFRALVCLCRF